jgi:hypothetical protein
MSPDTMEGHTHLREHGSCHRCGWIMDVSRVDRKNSRELGVRSRMRLCDDCRTDLQHSTVTTLGTHATARAGLRVAHRRHVA